MSDAMDSFAEDRVAMAETLARRERITDDETVAAMKAVPRHAFVPESRQASAYADRPLPIGDDQTISAPHMVGIMTDLLDAGEGDDVLEIGTGRGYHAAVTAEIVDPENVYSVEFSPELAQQARDTLVEAGYGDISVRAGDGREGWADHAPYDAAYFTCAVPEIPDPVLDQVRSGGTVLAPVGDWSQELVRARAGEAGIESRETRGGVRFVSIRGE